MLIATLLVACLSLNVSGCAKLGGLGGLLGAGGSDADITLSASNTEAIGAAIKLVMEVINADKNSQVVPETPVIMPTPEVPPIIAHPDPVVPPIVTPPINPAKTTESGSYLGAGNPNAYGPRPLWKFKHPGSYYHNITVSFDGVESFFIANGTIRTDPVAKGVNGALLKPGTLWKPVSDETPPNLVIHGPGGSMHKKCTLSY